MSVSAWLYLSIGASTTSNPLSERRFNSIVMYKFSGPERVNQTYFYKIFSMYFCFLLTLLKCNSNFIDAMLLDLLIIHVCLVSNVKTVDLVQDFK